MAKNLVHMHQLFNYLFCL